MAGRHSPAEESPDAANPVTVHVWFDPVCPYTWVTTRWLLRAAEQRPVELHWHLMSLDILNAGNEMDADGRKEMAESRAAGRLLTAVAAEHGSDMLGTAYTALGERYHRGGAELDRDTAAAALAEAGCDTSLATALDYTEDATVYDADLARSHAEGQQVLGGTGGSPILVVDGTGFFGPVLMSIPEADAAAELFDAVAVLGASPSFFQIERPRSGPPDVR